jgi:RNA polymerase sigma-70 factor (ECF subfamily)
MSQPPATDPDLVHGLQAGRRDAFVRFYGEYQAPIYNLCARVLGDREEAKDVTQEVFIKAFGRLPTADAESFKLRAWLYRVATNACFNHLRARKRLDGGADAQLANTASRVDEFERAQTVALVEQSLAEMNERYRTALVLKDLQGLPAEEIAEVMEVSRPTADVLVHRARASFKTAFAKFAGEDATAPAALGLVLLPLSVPVALQAMPPLPAHLAPLHVLPHPDISSAAGPAGVGLLTKIGAALTTKAAITAAAATVVIGGGVVAVKEVERGHTIAGTASAAAAQAGARSLPSPASGGAAHDGHWAGHHTPMDAHGHEAAHHAGAGSHHAGEHSGSGSHHSATQDAHDSVTPSALHAATTSSDSGVHSESMTTTHGGGDMSGSHESGTHD